MRLLILSSSTGGGHDMRARSLKAWCEKQQNPPSVFQYQALEESAGLYRFGVGVYNWIQKKWPILHHIYFNLLEVFQVSANKRLLMGKAKFAEVLRNHQPDVIVSVHAHTNHAFREVAQEILPRVRFVTYCGEMHGGYGFSKHWVDPEADAFIGSTTEICEAARQLGMPTKRTIHGGFLLNPSFYGAPLTDLERRTLLQDELGLDPDQFTLLLSTGANGALNHLGFLKALEKAAMKIQVVALCGHNDEAREAIGTVTSDFQYLKVTTLGYQADMFPLMQSVDGIVSRAGTGTTSEAIMAGCPVYLNAIGGIMPQEWITVKYLRANGIDAPIIDRASKLIPLLKGRIESDRKQNLAKIAIGQLAPPQSPNDIFRFLKEFASQAESYRFG